MHTQSGTIRIVPRPQPGIVLILCLTSFLLSCRERLVPILDPYSYIPLQVGNFIVYDVREEVYSAASHAPKILVWQEKDQIEGLKNIDNESSEFTVARYRRNVNTDYWQKVKEYRIKKFPDRILTISDNQTFLSMIFPVNSSVSWNGNLYNQLESEKYRYEEVNQRQQLSGFQFEHTLTVVERMDSSVINKYIGIKKYAHGIGLIVDEQTSFEYCQTEECLASDIKKIESGSRLSRIINQTGTKGF